MAVQAAEVINLTPEASPAYESSLGAPSLLIEEQSASEVTNGNVAWPWKDSNGKGYFVNE